MKTDSERLLDLIFYGNREYYCKTHYTETSYRKKNEYLADYLISKGVTIPVRCGECIYMEEAYEKHGFLICPASGMEIMNADFCSYGERKEE